MQGDADPVGVYLPAALPKPVAFVLGGGASYGAVQVGMLEAVAETGLVPDLVVGTSVGAINGALLAEDPHGAAGRLSELWLRMTRDTVFPWRPSERVRTWLEHHAYLVSADSLGQLLRRTLETERIEDLALPFSATAVDIVAGREVHLESGPLIPAVLASAAVPGVYPSVAINGRQLVDGGVVSNVPVAHALRKGARSVVVLDCGLYGLRGEAPNTLAETVTHAVAIMMRQQIVRELPAVAREVPVIYLPGPFPMTGSPLDFNATAQLIRGAYEQSRDFLAKLKPAGPGLYGTPPLVAPGD